MYMLLAEAKLLLVKTPKFGQSLLPTVKGMGFANIRGSGASCIAAAQLSGESQDGKGGE